MGSAPWICLAMRFISAKKAPSSFCAAQRSAEPRQWRQLPGLGTASSSLALLLLQLREAVSCMFLCVNICLFPMSVQSGDAKSAIRYCSSSEKLTEGAALRERTLEMGAVDRAYTKTHIVETVTGQDLARKLHSLVQ
jgi:hypothetical protein